MAQPNNNNNNNNSYWKKKQYEAEIHMEGALLGGEGSASAPPLPLPQPLNLPSLPPPTYEEATTNNNNNTHTTQHFYSPTTTKSSSSGRINNHNKNTGHSVPFTETFMPTAPPTTSADIFDPTLTPTAPTQPLCPSPRPNRNTADSLFLHPNLSRFPSSSSFSSSHNADPSMSTSVCDYPSTSLKPLPYYRDPSIYYPHPRPRSTGTVPSSIPSRALESPPECGKDTGSNEEIIPGAPPLLKPDGSSCFARSVLLLVALGIICGVGYLLKLLVGSLIWWAD